MIRKAFVMQLHIGQESEYQKRHNSIWPELEEALKSQGVSNYSIFLHKKTCSYSRTRKSKTKQNGKPSLKQRSANAGGLTWVRSWIQTPTVVPYRRS